MQTHLVLTLIGPDKPGIVERIADLIASHGGNWQQSSMARLGGQFAGILIASVEADRQGALLGALTALEAEGVRVVTASGDEPAPEPGRTLHLELIGNDKPGIVREISHALASRGVSIESLETEVVSGAMSADLLFRADALLRVPAGLEPEDLQAALEAIAADLMVEIRLAE